MILLAIEEIPCVRGALRRFFNHCVNNSASFAPSFFFLRRTKLFTRFVLFCFCPVFAGRQSSDIKRLLKREAAESSLRQFR